MESYNQVWRSLYEATHPYFSPAVLRTDPDLLLDDFQLNLFKTIFKNLFKIIKHNNNTGVLHVLLEQCSPKRK